MLYVTSFLTGVSTRIFLDRYVKNSALYSQLIHGQRGVGDAMHVFFLFVTIRASYPTLSLSDPCPTLSLTTFMPSLGRNPGVHFRPSRLVEPEGASIAMTLSRLQPSTQVVERILFKAHAGLHFQNCGSYASVLYDCSVNHLSLHPVSHPQ